MCNNDCQLAGNSGKKHIRFCSGMITGFPSDDVHVGFEMVNDPLHNGSYFIMERCPFVGVSLNAGKHAEIHDFVSVSGASFFAALHGSLQSRAHCPFIIIWTFGRPILSRSECPFSWQHSACFMSGDCLWNKWGSRRRYG